MTISTQRLGRVYRAYDAAGRLIYIGSTANIDQRIKVHAGNTWWWCFVDKVHTTAWMDLVDARADEIEAIRTERPLLNQQHNPDYAGLSRAQRLEKVAQSLVPVRDQMPDGFTVINDGAAEDQARVNDVMARMDAFYRGRRRSA